jgi:hypothetical protein
VSPRVSRIVSPRIMSPSMRNEAAGKVFARALFLVSSRVPERALLRIFGAFAADCVLHKHSTRQTGYALARCHCRANDAAQSSGFALSKMGRLERLFQPRPYTFRCRRANASGPSCGAVLIVARRLLTPAGQQPVARVMQARSRSLPAHRHGAGPRGSFRSRARRS